LVSFKKNFLRYYWARHFRKVLEKTNSQKRAMVVLSRKDWDRRRESQDSAA